MNPNTYWKNFSLGEELQNAGSFIYNSLFHLSGMRNFNRGYECFQVLYNAAVGIERLQKISIILVEHNDYLNQKEFEKTLQTHDHVNLMQRIRMLTKINSKGNINKLLNLLKEFYRVNRYLRFKAESISNKSDERYLLTKFIGSGIGSEISYEGFYPEPVTEQMRRYFGKTLIEASDILFNVIKDYANRLGILTTEMDSSSKGYRVFLQKETTFVNELNFKREILIYLISNIESDSALKYIRQIKPLEFDGSTAEYIEFLLNGEKDPSMIDELHSRYEDMTSSEVKKRQNALQLIGENWAYYDDDEDSEF